jgi:Zn-dependent protease
VWRWGWRFGVGFAVCILIHEMGHFVDIKRRGLPAEMPVFLPGLGAYVKWKAMNVSPRTMAQISLAGPLAGWMAAAGCYLMYARTGELFWAAVAIGLWACTGQLIFLLVGAGVVFRLFTKDLPVREDWGTFAYYAAVLGALALVLYVTPESLFAGMRR